MTQELTKWVFEPAHCKLSFAVTHFGITETEGHFNTFDDTINRKDWGMTWNNVMDFGGLAVGNDIRISCQIELLKQ